MSEIVYTCNSTNNKNIRDDELVILRKFESELYFEFGENEKNIKKRFYNDLETLNQDYNALIALKEKLLNQKKVEVAKEESEQKEEQKEEQEPEQEEEKENEEVKEELTIKRRNTFTRRNKK